MHKLSNSCQSIISDSGKYEVFLCHNEVGVSDSDEYVPAISVSTSLQPVNDGHTGGLPLYSVLITSHGSLQPVSDGHTGGLPLYLVLITSHCPGNDVGGVRGCGHLKKLLCL